MGRLGGGRSGRIRGFGSRGCEEGRLLVFSMEFGSTVEGMGEGMGKDKSASRKKKLILISLIQQVDLIDRSRSISAIAIS